MEQKFAKVAVNLSTNKPLKSFIYKVDDGQNLIIGSLVAVPFRQSVKAGFVVGFESQPKVKSIKTIASVIEEVSISQKDQELSKWIVGNYMCSELAAAKLFLPPGNTLKLKKSFLVLKNGQSGVKPGQVISMNKIEKIFNNKAEKLIKDGLIKPKYILNIKKPGRTTYLKLAGIDTGTATEKQRKLLLTLSTKRLTAKKDALSRSGCTNSVLKGAVGRGYVEVLEKPLIKKTDLIYEEVYKKHKKLTKEQQKAVEAISGSINKGRSDVFLLKGITGSGKTEVYAHAIENVLEKGKSAILLIPEIVMSIQVVARIHSRFTGKVAILHSGLTVSQRLAEYNLIKNGEISVVVGARSAIFAPLKNLGLIIVDEEHEGAYKQNRAPRYNAKDVAVQRAKIFNAVCVLGSATPSLETQFKAHKNVYKQLILKSKPSGSKVEIELIDMLKGNEKTLLGTKLVNSIKNTLDSNNKVLLLLNRRGFSSFLLCSSCGFVFKCKKCSVSLTYHQKDKVLKCHHCDYRIPAVRSCPECDSNWFRFGGSGTQKLEQRLKEIFPDELIIRLDRDLGGGEAPAIALKKFIQAKKAILLGTQMIGKGLDFSDISLVGIVNADTSLNFPDFRAGERTFQLLHQVAGRCGRGNKMGHVIIQTYNADNYAIKAVAKGSYDDFYEKEITYRKELEYPPFRRLINIGFSSLENEQAKSASVVLASSIKNINDIEIMGPVEAPISRIKNRFRWHILLKIGDAVSLELRKILTEFTFKDVSVAIDVDPQSLL